LTGYRIFGEVLGRSGGYLASVIFTFIGDSQKDKYGLVSFNELILGRSKNKQEQIKQALIEKQ
jgi:hypothetical protein